MAAFSKSDWALRTSQWPRYQAALPRLAQLVDVGSLYNQSFDFERLLTTRPDLLILAKWQLDGFANYLPVLQQLNIPYIVVDFNQGAEVKLASIRAMGQAMGHPERAERLASEYRQSLEDTQRRIREAQLPPPTAYIELGDKGPGEYSSSYGASVWGRCYSWPAPAISPPASSLARAFTRRLCTDPKAGRHFPRRRRLGKHAKRCTDGLRRTGCPLQARLAQYARRAGWPQLPAIKTSSSMRSTMAARARFTILFLFSIWRKPSIRPRLSTLIPTQPGAVLPPILTDRG